MTVIEDAKAYLDKFPHTWLKYRALVLLCDLLKVIAGMRSQSDAIWERAERQDVKIAELTDNLAQVLAPEWRDVGTLPKIDTDTCRSNDLLGCWPNGSMMVVYLDVCNGWMDAEGGEACVTMPAHWQPLPEPPMQPESV